MDENLASLKQVADFFRKDGESLTAFSAEWKNLPDADRLAIRQGIGNGSLSY